MRPSDETVPNKSSRNLSTIAKITLNKVNIQYSFLRARPSKSKYCLKHFRYQFIIKQQAKRSTSV